MGSVFQYLVAEAKKDSLHAEAGFYESDYGNLGLLALMNRALPSYDRVYDQTAFRTAPPFAFRFYHSSKKARVDDMFERSSGTNRPYRPALHLFLALHPRFKPKDDPKLPYLIDSIARGASVDEIAAGWPFTKIHRWDLTFHAPSPFQNDADEKPLYHVRFRRGTVAAVYTAMMWEKPFMTGQLLRAREISSDSMLVPSILRTEDPSRVMLPNLHKGKPFEGAVSDMLALFHMWRLNLDSGNLEQTCSMSDIDCFRYTVGGKPLFPKVN